MTEYTEKERLRAALVHSMERFNDMATILDNGHRIGADFCRASAKRIERVLTSDAHYHEDIFQSRATARAGGER